VGPGEVVHDLGEVVVARVGVAAAAVLVPAPDGHVVVAGDALHAGIDQQRPDGIALRPEAAEIAEAEELLAAPGAGVGQGRSQRVGVGVDASEGGDAEHRAEDKVRP